MVIKKESSVIFVLRLIVSLERIIEGIVRFCLYQYCSSARCSVLQLHAGSTVEQFLTICQYKKI